MIQESTGPVRRFPEKDTFFYNDTIEEWWFIFKKKKILRAPLVVVVVLTMKVPLLLLGRPWPWPPSLAVVFSEYL